VSLHFGETTKFGQGRADLLRRIASTGSLRKAVADLGMSYRAAWGYLRELEHVCGKPLVEPAGRGPRAGMRLTVAGAELLARYDTFRAEVEAAAGVAFAQAFPGPRPSARRKRAEAADFRAPRDGEA
jgi:molybdate transport system regulatory protein